MNPIWEFLYRYRVWLAMLPLVYAFFGVRWEFESNWVLWPAAAALCFAGAAVRAWARWHNSYAQGRKKALATTGPYAFVRNPLYVGNVLVIASAGVASGLAWFLPVVILWAFFVFAAATWHEEERLRVKYGEAYEAYRASVPAWFPRKLSLSRVRTAGSGFGMVLGVQILYASLALVPFLLKVANPFGLWPRP